jgi:hypothetical protein
MSGGTSGASLSSSGNLNLYSTYNNNSCLALFASGGVSSTIEIYNAYGTAVNAININSIAGGIVLTSHCNENNSIYLHAVSGGITLNGNTSLTMSGGTSGASLSSSGNLNLYSTYNNNSCLALFANGGVRHTVRLLTQ